MPLLKGNSPVRGNVCNADKRVPVSGRKGGPLAVERFRVRNKLKQPFYAKCKITDETVKYIFVGAAIGRPFYCQNQVLKCRSEHIEESCCIFNDI